MFGVGLFLWRGGKGGVGFILLEKTQLSLFSEYVLFPAKHGII